jgi:dipeptidyl aminopeptidase/acylaminoacyl peptidase
MSGNFSFSETENKKTRHFGSWKSSLTAELIFSRLTEMKSLFVENGQLYWSEQRPDGKTVIVRMDSNGTFLDITPPGVSVGTRVHEYGGGEFTVSEGEVFFSDLANQQVYRLFPGGSLSKVTESSNMRYADFVIDRGRNKIIAVREDHTYSDLQPENLIAAISLEEPSENVLISGQDFYSNPRLNVAGDRMCWLSWDHPNMPWDGTELWVGEFLPDGRIGERWKIAGGKEESIVQPEWGEDGNLYFVSDRSGWWNLYRWRDGRTQPLLPMEAEFGEPQWVFGQKVYSLASRNRLVCAYNRGGVYQLGILNTRSLDFSPVDVPFVTISNIVSSGEKVVFVGGSERDLPVIAELDLASRGLRMLYRTEPVPQDDESISIGIPFEFPTEGGQTSFCYFYPPRNTNFQAPEKELPPLLVMSHPGPTGVTTNSYRSRVQFWTSRGFAVLDVNYGGSTGYGRSYRERLNGNWGIVDVADCVSAARFFVEQGKVDGNRLAITGRSASGFTTLSALTFHRLFQAGASYYGVCDLEALAKETHKFESHYNDRLIGAYPAMRDVYIQRSPIHHTDRLSSPIILLQGGDDPVVLPSQAEKMAAAVRDRGLPVAYLTFPGERHGFSKAENRIRALEAELYFYSKVFGFEPADLLEKVPIENLTP